MYAPESALAFSGQVCPVTWIPLGLIALVAALSFLETPAVAEATGSAPATANPVAAQTQPQPVAKATPHFYIQEYQVNGNEHLLTQVEFEQAVYPFLGPYRTADDVEQARAALEKAYKDKGYPFVTVEIPQQNPKTGVIVLQVVKNAVGRLRVHGSRYYSLEEIKSEAPSLSEGTVPNFSQVSNDIRVLNDLPDRQVTPSVHPGAVPGTVDVDLNVKDTMPVHGSLELNNRYSAGTTALRLNGSVEYDNLWQLGHSIGANFQIAPENVSQVKVFSGFYSAHLPGVPWLTLTLQGSDQNSVSSLGDVGDEAGTGQTIGGRVVITLPAKTDFFHSISLGLDYKHATQDLMMGGAATTPASAFNFSPVTYYPISAAYSATWLTKNVSETDFNAGVTANLATISASNSFIAEPGGTYTQVGDFANNRLGANGSFIYFRGDLSHTRELPGGFQAYGKVQGQACGDNLISNEQFSVGGLSTVRGYLESAAVGDNGVAGTVELRTPALGGLISKPVGASISEWRLYIFGDYGLAGYNQPLPAEQNTTAHLASVGGGMRLRTFDHFNGSIDAAVPLDTYSSGIATTFAYSPHLTFRLWADF